MTRLSRSHPDRVRASGLPAGYQFPTNRPPVAVDRETGISIRFLREFDVQPDRNQLRNAALWFPSVQRVRVD